MNFHRLFPFPGIFITYITPILISFASSAMVVWSLRDLMMRKIIRRTGCSYAKAHLKAGAILLQIEKDPQSLNEFVRRFPCEVMGTRYMSPMRLFKQDQVSLLLAANPKSKVLDIRHTETFNTPKMYKLLPDKIQAEYEKRFEHIKKMNVQLKRVIRKGHTDGLHVYKRSIWDSLPSLPGRDPLAKSRGWQDMLYKSKIACQKWKVLDEKPKQGYNRHAEGMRLLRHHTMAELMKIARKKIRAECGDLILQRQC
ncbi:hypothetical protein XU18_0530 [Perkinsela sp. CCAP 1560/4]|nr:hypothetical protein XU18_0530 [Perkinsela sp. CCAP 1560/4]|eukprot:KNH09252.1 hypothetical protein XU18_0530 [Perkinsela sp. CCAP 1560/4]